MSSIDSKLAWWYLPPDLSALVSELAASGAEVTIRKVYHSAECGASPYCDGECARHLNPRRKR